MNSNCLGEKENLIDILCNAVDTDSKTLSILPRGKEENSCSLVLAIVYFFAW